MLKIYIGYDASEHAAAVVASRSLAKVTNGELEIELLCTPKLRDHGLLYRPEDVRGSRYDLVSNAPASTDFAISRFLVPMLCQSGYALFVDCDVVFREDPRHMLREVHARDAVSVVQHDHKPSGLWKMQNQAQTSYPKKNWSSVMLFNCDHIANRRLSVRDVNERPGRDLHAFYWLNAHEIGALDPRWNWLVGEQPPPPAGGGIAHFTLGGPWIPGWTPAEHDDLWLAAR